MMETTVIIMLICFFVIVACVVVAFTVFYLFDVSSSKIPDFDKVKCNSEIARLNKRIEGLSQDNLNLLNTKLMLRKRNKFLGKEINRLKKELELII